MLSAVQPASDFQALIENAPDGFLLLDPVREAPAQIACFRVRWLNDAAVRILGGPGEGIPGRRVHEVFPGQSGRQVLALCRRVAESGRPEADESDMDPGGSCRSLRIAVTPLGNGAVGLMFTDVTRNHAAQEHLLAADRRKDDFLALLSHELRNPLAGIMYSLEVLASHDERQSDEEALAMTIATRQVRQLQRLLDDLLDVSRIQRGAISFRPGVMDLADAADQAAQMLRPRFEHAGVQLVTGFPDDAVIVHADRTRVVQAVGNLLDNACKASPRGARVELRVGADQEHATVIVRDEGCGLAEDELAGLFEGPAPRPPKRGGEQAGLGLGLFLTRYLTEAQGGSVTAASAGPQRGATFVLTLPLCDRAAGGAASLEAGPASPPAAQPPGRLSILVVDDDADGVECLRMLLEAHGHQVDYAASAESALTAVQGRTPDVVLVDIGLPGMGGHELVRRLKKLPALADVPMIALSGFGQPSDLQCSHDAGLDAHLVKPVALNDLTTVIGRALRRDRPS